MSIKKKVEVDETSVVLEAPVEMTVKDPLVEEEVEMTSSADEREAWIVKAKEMNAKEETTPRDPDPMKLWLERSETVEKARVAREIEAKKEVKATVEDNIEDKVAEQFPDAYRVTDWAGHSNYECNKCGFADLDKFKLYAHLIQAHSGIEYDYRGETTHS